MEKVVIGNAELYCGDCRDLIPLIVSDAIVTDPPYGLNIGKTSFKSSGLIVGEGHRRVAKKTYSLSEWDESPPDDSLINLILSSSPIQVIFGGNYFSLPPTKCWLIWDKVNGGTNFADCEMAWTNLDKPVRKIEWLWNGFARKNNEPRFDHPTQKPVGVMQWCIQQAGSPAVVFDPFMGSGTTGVAALNLGLKFIGCERERSFFDLSCERIERAQHQGKLDL